MTGDDRAHAAADPRCAPARKPRRRRAALWASAVIAALALVLGVKSQWRLDAVEYRWAPPAALVTGGGPDRREGPWVRQVHTVRLWSAAGTLGAAWSVYESFDDTREGLERWSEYGGWARNSASTEHLVRDHERLRVRGPLNWRFGRLGVYVGGRQGSVDGIVSAPHWLVLLAAASPLLATGARAVRRWRRRRHGRCAECGYEQGGGGVTGPCPECGTAAQG